MQLSKLNLLAVSIAVISTPTFANEVPTLTLPEIAITATRTPTPLKNTIAQTTVIDEDELQRYQGQSVIDVLRQQAGFYVTQNGGDGTSSNFSLRGLPARNLMVLIDGIRYTSLSTGYAELSLIPADQIDRIEILHGASGSSLYGADAMGGVIQIFTKGLNANQSNVAVTVGAGTENSYKGQITGQYANQNSTLSLSAGYEKTDGINIASVNNAYRTSVDADKDGFESKNASLVAKYRFNENIEVGVTGLVAKSEIDNDGGDYTNIHGEQENGAFNGFVNYQKNNFNASLKHGESFDKLDSYFSATPSSFNTKQKQTSLQLGYQLPVGQVIGGAELLQQSFNGQTSYTGRKREVKSGFVGYLLNTPDYDLQANIRHDRNEQYGNKTTYNLGGAYRILPNTRLGASYATGFRMPNLNDLYGYSPSSVWSGITYPGYQGNSNLKPESNKNWEVFVENRNQYHKTRLTGFQNDIEDGIVQSILQNGDRSRENRAETQIKGVSLTSDWQVNNILFGLNYTHQDVKGRNDANLAWDKVKTQPENMGMLYIGYQQPKFDIRAEVQYADKRNDGYYTNQELDDYTLLNLSGNYYVNPNLTISSRLNNLTGKEYETIYGYNQKGVNAFVSATYKWF